MHEQKEEKWEVLTLNEYKGIKLEIADLEKRISKLRYNGSMILGKVKASSSNFPYGEMSYTIHGADKGTDNTDAIRKLEVLLSDRLKKSKEEEKKIEEYIQSIKSPVDRLILRKKIFDGLSQEDIAEITGYERSNISKRINKYLKE